MSLKSARLSKLLSLAALIFTMLGCQSSGNDDESVDPKPVNGSGDSTIQPSSSPAQFAADFPGFRYEGAVQTIEPAEYPYISLVHIESYNDSARAVFLSQNRAQSITHYLAGNFYQGQATRWFAHGGFPNGEANQTTFQFVNPSFLLTTYNPSNGLYMEKGIVFGMATKTARILTWSRQYLSQFIDRYIIRYISGVSLWPYHAWNDVDEKQFLATSEESEPKAFAHFFVEGMSVFPYDLKSNMYTGFLTARNDGTYAGIAKGSQNLDTALITTLPEPIYSAYQGQAYIDKHLDTLYLGLFIRFTNSNKSQISLYRLVEPLGQLELLYADREMPYSVLHFRQGRFFAIKDGKYLQINLAGKEEPLDYLNKVANQNLNFKRNKIFASRTNDDLNRVELYSRSYE